MILAGVERAKASRNWVDGYIPNPQTWLNQGRWEDQPSEVIPTATGPPNDLAARDAAIRAEARRRVLEDG